MSLDFGPRLHAWWYALFRTSDFTRARRLYNETERLIAQHELETEEGRAVFAHALSERLCAAFRLSNESDQASATHAFVSRLVEFEGWFQLPDVDWAARHSVSELWAIRDEVEVQHGYLQDIEATTKLIAQAFYAMLEPVFGPEDEHDNAAIPDGITVPTQIMYLTPNLAESIETMLGVPALEEVQALQLFPRLERNLSRNVVRASGGNPDDMASFNKTPKLPTQVDQRDPNALIDTYLTGTPLFDILKQPVDFTIPTKTRYEHHHIVAGTGHGKTQTLQYLIAHDLEAVAAGERTVIVIDSQGDLIENIAKLKMFAPGEPLHDRITIIDPTDVEYPVSLNMFDVGVERLQSYEALERERLTNSILELYDFVLGSLLDAGMTQKQSVIFRYVTRLMLHIPGATIHTLRELMEPGAEEKFAEHIAKLSGSARHFFETEFAGNEFKQTKQQVLRRLWGILENQTFERMFSHPKSKLDLFSEMNAGRVILFNTAKDLLKEQGTQIFGRFFIALITQAAQERATLPANKRLSTIVYVDEAQDYFDRNTGIILAQARKYNVGMVLAHQFLGQLPASLQDAFAANTSIKFAGGVSAKDARTLAPMLYCEPSLIEAQPKGSFAAMVKGTNKGALPLAFPFGHMEGQQQMASAEREQLRAKMRAAYAVPIGELAVPSAVKSKQSSEASDASEGGNVDVTPGDGW